MDGKANHRNNGNGDGDCRPWYERNPARFQAEVDAMHMVFPDAEQGMLDDGRICWSVKTEIGAPAADGGRRTWEFLVAYDEDRPEAPVAALCYAVSPNEQELLSLLRQAGREARSMPHTIHDARGLIFAPHVIYRHSQLMLMDGVQQATLQLRGTIRLAAIFEQALVDEDTWEAFRH